MIIGAGLCGLHAASRLHDAGHSILVLEKSRGLGGRAATRRWENHPVDHGAQFFTAKNPLFASQVNHWKDSGICHEWTRGFHRFSRGKLHDPEERSHPRYACRAGVSSLGCSLGSAISDHVLCNSKVNELIAKNAHWEAKLENGNILRSRSLLLTPPPQLKAALYS
jgi:renalase